MDRRRNSVAADGVSTPVNDDGSHGEACRIVEHSPLWRDRISPELVQRLDGPEEVLRLRPTARSLLHG
jgi:hypothetical protein